jgi:hypothetical protein
VQFKEAGFTTGYIQFGVSGALESRRGVWDATTDENTVLFTKDAAENFRKLRDIVEDRAAASRHGHGGSQNPAAAANVGDELTRLADLRDRGVLTEDEFAEQKARLLGKPAGAGPSPAPQGHTSASGLNRKAQSVAAPVDARPKRGLGRALGIGCVSFLVIIIGLAAIGSQVDQTNITNNSADEAVASSDASAESTAPLPIAVSATELFRAYENNEASAQGYFGKRQLLVSGTVDKVTLDFMDDPIVGLRTPNEFMSAQAALAESAKDEAGKFSPGDKVKLLCEDVSEVAGTPMLKDCRTAPKGTKSEPVQWSKGTAP